jgi:hypothetical protein
VIKNFAVALCIAFVTALPGSATLIGGVEFPQGLISFADAVVSYTPGAPAPTLPHQGASSALGAPDYAGGTNCASQAACKFVTLGDGGNIVLRFTNNFLTGSDDNALDLWVFEIGPDVEDTFVEVSKNGIAWSSVGKVFGSTAGVDLDAYGFGSTDLFSYVRLTDDTNEGDQSGATVGADIDAIGAISTIATSEVPEPATTALIAAGLLAAASLRELRQRKHV